MITLRWNSTAGADIVSYKVYRSIVGFRSPVLSPSALSGLTLSLDVNGSLFTVTFDGVSSAVANINAVAISGSAVVSQVDENFFIFRASQSDSIVKITGGTALSLLGLSVRDISEKSESFLIGSVTDAGEEALSFVDRDGCCRDWYAVSTVDSFNVESSKSSFVQVEETDVSVDGTAFNQRPNNDDLLIDADFLKNVFLFGVSLKDDNGNDMSDYLIEFYIRSAQMWLERELQIAIQPTTITSETHDYVIQDYMSFGFLKLNYLPVRRVSRIAMKFPTNDDSIEFNPKWFKVDSRNGMVNLIPTVGSISSLLMGQGGSFLPLLYNSMLSVPAIIEVDYEAGFVKGKVPSDILEIIAMKAAIGPLNIAGDLIVGAGIASSSISLDGLSQSIGTTSSATNAGYGARIIQYEKQIKNLLPKLAATYRGIQMSVG